MTEHTQGLNSETSAGSASKCCDKDPQLLYAQLLGWGVRLGLTVMVVSGVLYFLELIPALIPLARVTELWGLSAGALIEQTHGPQGWRWVSFLPAPDILPFLGIAILAGGPIWSSLLTALIAWRRNDRLFALFALVAAAVVLLAATGAVSPHH